MNIQENSSQGGKRKTSRLAMGSLLLPAAWVSLLIIVIAAKFEFLSYVAIFASVDVEIATSFRGIGTTRNDKESPKRFCGLFWGFGVKSCFQYFEIMNWRFGCA